MSENTILPLMTLGGTRPLRNEEIEAFIDQLPHATLLVDVQKWRLISANLRFTELSGYTRNELIDLELHSLLPEWQPGPPALTPDEKATASPWLLLQPLIRRNRTQLMVHLMAVTTGPKQKNLVVIVEAADPTRWPFEQQHQHRFWNGLNDLVGALQKDELNQALNAALKACHNLTQASHLVVYYLQENNPQLHRCAIIGSEDLFPEYLTAQDLSHMSRPKVWEAGKRPSGTLQYAARTAELAFLASAPIGQDNAIIGLVALGDDQPAGSEFVEQAARLLAGAISVIFQRHTWGSNLQARLSETSGQIHIAATLEERAQEGILTLGPDLSILRMNPAIEIMMGYAGTEVAGQPVEKVLIGPEGLMPALISAQEGNPTYNLGSVHLYRRYGESFLALVRIFPVVRDEKTEQILVFIEDLSEQEQIRLHAQQLEHRALLGEVTAIFAHEVRNPINNISTGLQLMAINLPTDDPSQESIGRMMQDCDRLAELIKSVLAFSRPTDYEMEPVDLPMMMQRLLERLRPRITRLNINYDLRAEPDCPPIRGNLRALEQVFSNLITNALQAMGEGGGNLFIKVQPVQQDGHKYLEASVADTGPGIPKELQERIFHPFFTTERGGTGLGLAIAKRIITAHKGTIRLTSFPGGTIFHVLLPQDEA
jgi:two-component system, NtrC family, sensor histidine kinase AtoS